MTIAADRTEALMALFTREGYRRVEPAVLQPVDVFLDLSGEDIRRRMFVTQDAAGNELCLRPDYTIPVSRDYLASVESGSPAAYSYLGPVFRLRAGETGEFPQAGIESFGREDREAADAEILALGIEAVTSLGLSDMTVKLGDVAILTRLLAALDLPALTQRRVLRAVVQGRAEAALAEDDAAGEPRTGADHAGLLAAIEGQDPKAAHAFVEDVLSIAGISKVGGRTAGEIAERFLARAAARNGAISAEMRAVIGRYLAISGDPDTAAVALRALARDAALDLDAAIDSFEARTGFMAARGIDVASLSFSAGFARNLDYYTGFIFEVIDPHRPHLKPIVGGGRYDGLLTHLGAPQPIPAVGCSIWLDRLGLRSAMAAPAPANPGDAS
ncbi:ATP phosphoribosyltransferase regulatory subunit [Chelatococcus sp. SYSU_G07232]|uniref:Histidine--tRNA ligase n=1 Tax=Chelatococcus albus TaxID=3047466 RepID=A0ABT7AEU3_9HYPH|nr:ATP phosphoribosyltransferase regulatory subunit [Chelatococcus sp. SYSU_G07232]MDJ1157893.1 ATP phosphoribosyltransferase regulatory subunit [Chelatococcus sp. SYSU_G07232]